MPRWQRKVVRAVTPGTITDTGLLADKQDAVPRGMPEDRLSLINSTLNEALRQPDIRTCVLDISNLPTGRRASAFALRIAKEKERALRVPLD